MQSLIDAVELAAMQVERRELDVNGAANDLATAEAENTKNKSAVASASAALAAAYAAAGAAAAENEEGAEDLEAAIAQAKVDRMAAIVRSNESNVALGAATEKLRAMRQGLDDLRRVLRDAQAALDEAQAAAAAAAAAKEDVNMFAAEEEEKGDMDLSLLFTVPLPTMLAQPPAKSGKFHCCRICSDVAHPESKCKMLADGEDTLQLLRGIEEGARKTFAGTVFTDEESRKRLIDALANVDAVLGEMSDADAKKVMESPFSTETQKRCPFCLVTFDKSNGMSNHRSNLANCPIAYVFTFIMASRDGKSVANFFAVPKRNITAVAAVPEADVAEEDRLVKFFSSAEAAMMRLQEKIDALEAENRAKDYRMTALEQRLDAMENAMTTSQGTPVKKMRTMRSFSVYDMDTEPSIDPSLLANL